MKARTRLVLSLLPPSAALLLASCATTHDRDMHVAGSATKVNDARYIQAVETVAARRGVQVHWVHPPKVPADG